MLNFLLIGNGQWGQNYISTIQEHFHNINLTIATKENWRNLLITDRPDAVIIATQPQYHIKIARETLSRHIHTIIEKPLALNYAEALMLKDIKTQARVLINNIHLFSPAMEMISEKIKKENLNETEINSFGYNRGPVRDYSSLFDYGAHDIAMGLYLTKSNVKSLIAWKVNEEKIDNSIITNYAINMDYNNSIRHRMIVGNAGSDDPRGIRKRRGIKINTSTNTYEYDDLLSDKLYMNGIAQKIRQISPLQNMLDCFIKSIIDNSYKDDRFGLDLSCETVKLLEQANFYIEHNS